MGGGAGPPFCVGLCGEAGEDQVRGWRAMVHRLLERLGRKEAAQKPCSHQGYARRSSAGVAERAPRCHHPLSNDNTVPSPPIPFSILASKREAGPVCIHEAPAMDQEPVVAGNPGLSVNKAARGQVCSPKMSVQCQLPTSSWINGGRQGERPGGVSCGCRVSTSTNNSAPSTGGEHGAQCVGLELAGRRMLPRGWQPAPLI